VYGKAGGHQYICSVVRGYLCGYYRSEEKWCSADGEGFLTESVTALKGKVSWQWEPRNTTKPYRITNFIGEIYWEGKTQEGDCLCSDKKQQRAELCTGLRGGREGRIFQGWGWGGSGGGGRGGTELSRVEISRVGIRGLQLLILGFLLCRAKMDRLSGDYSRVFCEWNQAVGEPQGQGLATCMCEGLTGIF